MKLRRGVGLSWMFVGVLAISCAVLAVLQYRWTSEITRAERERLRGDLHSRLLVLRRDFDANLTDSLHALTPLFPGGGGSPQWRSIQRQPGLFRRIGIASMDFQIPTLVLRDPSTGDFEPTEWPREWSDLRDALSRPDRPQPPDINGLLIFDLPRFGGPRDRPPIHSWVIAELDVAYIRQTFLPSLVAAHLNEESRPRYDVKLIDGAHASQTIYLSDHRAATLTIANADDTVPLLDGGHPMPAADDRPPPPPRGLPPGFHPPGPPRRGEFDGDEGRGKFFRPPPQNGGPGPWLLLARHRAGSLEALVENTRRRNLAISGGILLLIITTACMLVRFTRASERLAQLQMNFVAGVSHELRSPLAVIRTAAFNLQRDGFAARPDQVRRYGRLIGDESGRLERLVDNVLQFASAKAGHVIRRRETVNLAELIATELESFSGVLAASRIEVARDFASDLAPVSVDPAAFRQAMRNILENAIKYGASGGWIRVSARAAHSEPGDIIEIRIADRGPGIPADEQKRIFEPFFRGQRAIEDQIHGAGLGLSLVREIVEAHGGAVSVNSSATGGTEFTIRLPMENSHEPAHSAD